MSWKNHVPKREPDFEISTQYQVSDIEIFSDVYYIKASCWVNEEIVKTEQGRVGNKPSVISVDRNLQCPHRINYNKWQENIAEAILLGEDGEYLV